MLLENCHYMWPIHGQQRNAYVSVRESITCTLYIICMHVLVTHHGMLSFADSTSSHGVPDTGLSSEVYASIKYIIDGTVDKSNFNIPIQREQM